MAWDRQPEHHFTLKNPVRGRLIGRCIALLQQSDTFASRTGSSSGIIVILNFMFLSFCLVHPRTAPRGSSVSSNSETNNSSPSTLLTEQSKRQAQTRQRNRVHKTLVLRKLRGISEGSPCDLPVQGPSQYHSRRPRHHSQGRMQKRQRKQRESRSPRLLRVPLASFAPC